jgi:hypothetical protein
VVEIVVAEHQPIIRSAGMPARVAMETLGHSKISITMDTFTRVLPELQRDAADAMDRALRGRSLDR